MLAWLADDRNLEVFRQGKDIYIEMASKIYGREITKEDKLERGLGKEAELACGYQLWWKTLLTRCWVNGVKIDPVLALQTVKLYRNEHPKIVEFWADINRAFVECILYGKDTETGRLHFELHKNVARMFFPSGRCIMYPQPSVKKKIKQSQKTADLRSQLKQIGMPNKAVDEACMLHNDEVESSAGKARQVACYYRESSTNYKWVETSTYGGKLTENASQGVACDVLVDASLRLAADRKRFGNTVMTAHDELVQEQKKGREDLAGMIECMCIVPKWAEGLPLAAEGWTGERYRK